MNREDLIREIHERYRQSGRALNELQRRLWAAAEAIKLGRGGIAIVSQALRISPNTIKRGIQEMAAGQTDSMSDANTRIRKPGGGRKSTKTSSDRSTRTGSNDGSADAELREFDCVDDTPPIPPDEKSRPVNDTASDQGPNQPGVA